MYCLQWLIPVLLIPKPMNPALLYNHVMFMVLYLFGFFVERKPCTICSLVLYYYYLLIVIKVITISLMLELHAIATQRELHKG